MGKQNKLGECVANWHALQEMLKEILQREGQLYARNWNLYNETSKNLQEIEFKNKFILVQRNLKFINLRGL